ncbi:hypothetical protein E8L99_22485 [Phreatobacter aquaticus]|uniref:Twin-arginine translocation signal domain-containing protein n=1 Tax=Phreatobacter aquaticus TaxID=2570229 RepID=A0A4D7QSA3_9HYPH|nr:hypothetical protein [Phreatobacter aquaticus]QCK88329.1 hypothetical protein E8L99_22485 [Phreatobacter aquaticus]
MKRRDFLTGLLGLATLAIASTASAPQAQASWVSDGANAVGRGVRRTGRAIGRGTRSVGRSIGRGTRRVRRQIFGRRR